jgi:ATP/maltotriose-dependent transcriptional regulator MalT
MLNFASHELGELRESDASGLDFARANAAASTKKPSPAKKMSAVKIIADKIRLPQAGQQEAAHAVRRPRLFAHLEKSLAHFSATLITGRTGTGKTALAADYARRGLERGDFAAVAWYKPDATDAEWATFFSYFTESLRSVCAPERSVESKSEKKARVENESVTDALARQLGALDEEKPLLIVLDDLHTVFDLDWFAEFFGALLSLPAPNVRVLLLARSQPPFPLLRLRSKHALDLVDEKLLAFTTDETVEFFKNYKLPQSTARTAHKIAYGKIAKLKEIAEKKR